MPDAMSRLGRLDELLGLLKSRDFATGAELAVELGVSIRTLRRDLEVLRERGVPVEADRGRGGGVRVAGAWSAGRVHLNATEAMDLLLSLTVAEKIQSPLLLQNLTAIRRKLAASFAEPQAGRIRTLRRRILIGQNASAAVLANIGTPDQRVLGLLTAAFFDQRCADIDYVDQQRSTTTRTIEAQFLYLNMPVWYVLAWDRLREAPRTFRIDRITRAQPREESFRLRPAAPFLASAEHDAQTL
jgi:predicted DNA-binding transcriptional regulator YafY